jgi:hypothetical protein
VAEFPIEDIVSRSPALPLVSPPGLHRGVRDGVARGSASDHHLEIHTYALRPDAFP